MPDEKDIPVDNGRRAAVDPVTGAVRGSGMGAGGGQPGEDYSSDPETGSGYPRTGVEGSKAAPPLPKND